MASKKYTLLAGFLCLLFSSVFSQTQKRSYEDSTVIPAKRMPQHTEFLNGTNNFPAKPRNQWEIGIKGGAFTVIGDVSNVFPTPGFGIHVRKALGYVFSLRLEYMYGIGKGQNYRANENFGNNTPWVTAGYVPGAEYVFYNYKTKAQDLSLEGIINLNNIRFHKAQTKMSFYGLFGIGATWYQTHLNLLNDAGKYDFTTFPQAAYSDRKDLKKSLRDYMDDSYETEAQNEGENRAKLGDNTLKTSVSVGGGIAFRLNKTINIAIEDRVTMVHDDFLDGQTWQEHPAGDATLTPSNDLFNYLTVGLNFNIGKKAVEPLWWVNPLDYAYAEIRNPKLMNIPKPVLPDADGDHVTDQFDLEQTPAGVPVDVRGVSRDTDGDGVPDAKDKELITPTYCQPVDADGVGKCPCPDTSCYAGLIKDQGDCSAKLGALPSISFKSGSNSLDDDAKAVLGSVAARLRNAPECKVVVIGYCSSDKKQQQLSWDHVNKVITHLVEQEGISQDRFIFNYGQEGGDCNTVDLRAATAGEEGPNTVAPPHPNLRKK
jgi:outer membrane protein OmpA-like peptidoglycan-associated protein